MLNDDLLRVFLMAWSKTDFETIFLQSKFPDKSVESLFFWMEFLFFDLLETKLTFLIRLGGMENKQSTL